MTSTPKKENKSKKTHAPLSTKTGDKGMTSLASGQRVSKSSATMQVIGGLDELNSWLGVVVANLTEKEFAQYKEQLQKIQHNLFIVGADVAQSSTRLELTHLQEVEKFEDALLEIIEDHWHTKFLLPGGTKTGAWLDIARTVCRRVERDLVALDQEKKQSPLVLQYLNRLSDLLYALRCVINYSLQHTEQQFTHED